MASSHEALWVALGLGGSVSTKAAGRQRPKMPARGPLSLGWVARFWGAQGRVLVGTE